MQKNAIFMQIFKIFTDFSLWSYRIWRFSLLCKFLDHWPTKALHVSHILHCIWLFALLCYFVFIFSSFFFFQLFAKKIKKEKTPNTSSKYSLLKSCEMLKVLTCSFVKWLTIKCQSCCSLTNFLLIDFFFSSTYELPVINLLFALKFCFCKKLPHFNEHAAAAIQVWFAANSPLFCADACWDSGECLGFQMIPANQSTDCSQISACCPSAGKTLWMIEGKNKKKTPKLDRRQILLSCSDGSHPKCLGGFQAP